MEMLELMEECLMEVEVWLMLVVEEWMLLVEVEEASFQYMKTCTGFHLLIQRCWCGYGCNKDKYHHELQASSMGWDCRLVD